MSPLPPYSPDLAPIDCHLFWDLQNALAKREGESFNDDVQVPEFVTDSTFLNLSSFMLGVSTGYMRDDNKS